MCKGVYFYFPPLLFIVKSLGGTLRQPNSSVANISCTCMCVKESKLKTSTSKNEMRNTSIDNFLMQVLLARFWLLWYKDHSVLWSSSSFFFLPLFTHSLFELPQSQIHLFLSSSSVLGHANKNSVSLGS